MKIFAAALLFAATANAATLTGVVVTDDQIPIPNLQLTLRSTNPRLERKGVTDEKGRFVFLGVRSAALYSLTGPDQRIGFGIMNVGPRDEIKLHGFFRSGICGGIYWNEDVDPQKNASSYPPTNHIRVYICE
jgi:hypothetical protein